MMQTRIWKHNLMEEGTSITVGNNNLRLTGLSIFGIISLNSI